jgi:molybdenum cofactor cytidylyltransferase
MTKFGAVLLAAGASRRFTPDNKLLAEIRGRPLIRLVAKEVTCSEPAEIVVVTGSDRLRIENALEGLAIRFAYNQNWSDGMAGSIAIGVTTLGSHVEGAFIVPGDMPYLTSDLLRVLGARFDQSQTATIVYPVTAKGEQRNPVLWPRRFFPELASLSGRSGAKRLLSSLASYCKPVPGFEDHIFADVDVPEDLKAARSNFRSR